MYVSCEVYLFFVRARCIFLSRLLKRHAEVWPQLLKFFMLVCFLACVHATLRHCTTMQHSTTVRLTKVHILVLPVHTCCRQEVGRVGKWGFDDNIYVVPGIYIAGGDHRGLGMGGLWKGKSRCGPA